MCMCGRGQVGHRDLHGVEVGECACVEWEEWDRDLDSLEVGEWDRHLHGVEVGECTCAGGDNETYTVQRWVSVCVWRGTSGT